MIGFFDSGSGGLSVLSRFRVTAPRADVVYFGDIKNAPYGEKNAEELAALTVSGVEILRTAGATSIVSACNSVSASILAGAAHDMPVVEMSRPTAQFMQRYAGQKFLLLATPATVASGMYQKALEGIVEIDTLPIPELAGTIEFGEQDGKIAAIVTAALNAKKGEKYDGVLLGCTHYPLALNSIAPLVREILSVEMIIDPAEPVAEAAIKMFPTEGNGSLTFLISKDTASFRARVASLFPNISYTISLV